MNGPQTRQRPGRTGREVAQQIEGLRRLYGSDARSAFVEAIRDAGIAIMEPERITANGSIIRFHVEGDHRGARNGWAVLFDDATGAGGAFGHWRTGSTGTWRAGRGKLSPTDAARCREAIAAAKRQHDAKRAKVMHAAAERALRIWAQAAAADPAHAYLIRKRVQPHGVRQLDRRLVIPLRDADHKLWSLQFIAPDGTKRFLPGGRKAGCYYAIGKVDTTHRVLCIAEGFATAASIHEANGQPVAVAFDCGNLEAVARALRAKYPDAAIKVCADNDAGTPGNPGLTHAKAAARSVGGYVAIPPAGFCDFNDAANAGGDA